VIIPVVAEKNGDYARQVASMLKKEKFYVDIDDSNHQLNRRIRDGQIAQYNYILICGEKEQADQTVTVRIRDASGDKAQETLSVEEVLARFRQMRANKTK